MIKQTKNLSYFKHILSLLLFGLNGIIASYISLTSYEIVFLRTLMGSLFLIAIFILTGNKLSVGNNKLHLIYLVISGIAMGISWMFLYEAYQQIGVSIATLVYYSGPVIVMVLSPILFKERFTIYKIAGFLVVLCGIVFINIQAVSDGKTTWGLFCGLMSAITYSIMVIFNKKAKSITGLKNSTLQLTISFLTVGVFIGIRQGFIIHITQDDWIPILILGILNTGIGCYLYFSSIGDLPVQSVAILGYLEPLLAVGFSVLLLKEILQPIQILGAVLVISGAIFAEYYTLRKNRSK